MTAGVAAALIETFRYQETKVRTVLVDGEPGFVLADLCGVLDIRNGRDVAARLADDQKGVAQIDTPGGRQQMTIVNESGMYEVVIRSDKPEAVSFRRWITGEVLPQLRRLGSYSMQPAQPEIPATYAEALRAAADQAERAEAAESRVRELAPAASSWNELAEATGDYSVADAAKVLSRDPKINIKERALFQYMHGLEWVFKRDGRWKAMRAQLDTGRLAEKVARPYWHEGRGEMVAGEPTVRITPKGLQELHRRLGGGEQLALIAGVS